MSGARQADELKRNIWRCVATLVFVYNTGGNTACSSPGVSIKLDNCAFKNGLLCLKACITLFSVRLKSEVGISNQTGFNLIEQMLHM